MSDQTIGRTFLEIGAKTDALKQGIDSAVTTVNTGEQKMTAAGRRLVASFERSLNPTTDLAKRLQALETAGKSSADIMMVFGKKIEDATAAARAHGQAIPDIVKRYEALGKETGKAGLSAQDFGAKLQDFARNPLQAAKTGITGLLGSLGTVGTTVGIVGGSLAALGTAIFTLGKSASDTAERLQNLSVSSGLSIQDLQALERISAEAGTEGLNLQKALATLNRQMVDGAGGEFVRVLNALRYATGESAFDLDQGIIPALDEFRLRILSVADPTEQARLANSAFGKGLRDLIPHVTNSSASISEQIDMMKRAGITWTDETQSNLMALDDGLDKLGRTWEALAVTVKSSIGSMLGAMFRFSEAPQGTMGPQQFYEQWAKDKGNLPQFDPEFFHVRSKDPMSKTADAIARAKAIASGQKENLDLLIKIAEVTERFNEATAANDVKRAQNLANELAQLRGNLEARKAAGDFEGKILNLNRNLELQYRGMHDPIREINLLLADQARILDKDLAAALKKSTDSLKAFSTISRGWAGAEGKPQTIADLLEPQATKGEGGALGSAAGGLNQVSTILTDLGDRLTRNLVEWKNWGNTIRSIAQDVAQSAIRKLFESIVAPKGGAAGGIGALFGAIGKKGGGLVNVPGMPGVGGPAAGGALGFLGGPWGAAIMAGAAVGVGIFSKLLSGEKRREEIRQQRAAIQAGYQFTAPEAISHVGAFGYSVDTDLTGKVRAMKNPVQVVFEPGSIVLNNDFLDASGVEKLSPAITTVISRAIMRGTGQIADNVAYAAG